METRSDLYDSLDELSKQGDEYIAGRVQYIIETYL